MVALHQALREADAVVNATGNQVSPSSGEPQRPGPSS